MHKLTIEDMQRRAAEHRGWCRSTTYVNCHVNLLWQCHELHPIFSVSPERVQMGTWCPICATNVSENICRQYFEILFGKPFCRVRPKWLINSSGNRLELDGYCEELKLAFEYNGIQHYREVTAFCRLRQTPAEILKKQMIRDAEKRSRCKEAGVSLIEIPYTIKHDQIGVYIIEECNRRGLRVVNPDLINVDYRKFNCYFARRLRELSEILKQRGFKCLAQNYIDNTTKIDVMCKHGHQFKISPAKIIEGVGCSTCSKKKKGTIEEIREIAKRNNFICLSSKYINAYTNLDFRCLICNYVWSANPTHIKSGTGCPICKRKIAAAKSGSIRRRYTIEYMKELATKKFGKCNSDAYGNDGNVKLEFECFFGHVWWAAPYKIISGQWCPVCAIEKRKMTRRLNST